MSEEVAAGGVPEGSTGTGTEPGEIAPPAAPIAWGTHKQPETPDELAEAITSASLDVQVSVLLGMLERVGDQRDALKARIDAYEGAVDAWEEMGRLIEQSSLGTAEARAAQLAAPEGVGRAIVLGAEYLRERDEALADLHREREVKRINDQAFQGVVADRDDWRNVADDLSAELADTKAERDRLRAGIMAAEVHGELIVRMRESVWREHEAERDRLRAVVDAVREVRRRREASREVAEPADWDDEDEVERMSRRLAVSTIATSDALDVMFDRLDQLDVSPTIGGTGSTEGAPHESDGDGLDLQPWSAPPGERGADDAKHVGPPPDVDPTSPTYDPDQYGTFTQADGARNSPLGSEHDRVVDRNAVEANDDDLPDALNDTRR